MDAFFAAVEQLDNPELRGKPVIVGAPPNARGVVATCSYEARPFGVHSAMPSRQAYKLCPHGVFVPPRGHRYKEVSDRIFVVFDEFTPFVEPLSIDEAFLDVTGSMHLFGGAVETGKRLKARIREETSLTASIGVAPNKFLAKLASDLDKPDGLTVVPRDPASISKFLAPMALTRVWGIGKKSAAVLERVGLTHIGQVQKMQPVELERLVGAATTRRLMDLAHGIDHRAVVTQSDDKSMSHEHTFGEDCRDWTRVESTILHLAEKVGARLRRGDRFGRTVFIKLRWHDFTTITRQQPLRPPSHSDRHLIACALELVRREKSDKPVRLIGFGVTSLIDRQAADVDYYQPDLLPDETAPPVEGEKESGLDAAVDKIRRRYGNGSILRGIE